MSIADTHAENRPGSYKNNGNKGVAKAHKALKRAEAEARNAKTPFNRTKAYRLAQKPAVTVNVAEFLPGGKHYTGN